MTKPAVPPAAAWRLKQLNNQEWILDAFRDKVFLQIIPFYEVLPVTGTSLAN